MRSRRYALRRSVRLVLVGALLLSLGRLPIPGVEFHSLEHKHGPGEVCALHEHLIESHPADESTGGIARPHWHWVNPMAGLAVSARDDDPGTPDPTALAWDDDYHPTPRIAGRSHSRALLLPAGTLARAASLGARLPSSRNVAAPARSFAATYPPRVSRAALLQTWVC